jgi:hypothetical protein
VGANLLAQLAWGASGGAHPDAVADARLPAPLAADYAGKLAVPELDVPASSESAAPALAAELYIPDAARSAA